MRDEREAAPQACPIPAWGAAPGTRPHPDRAPREVAHTVRRLRPLGPATIRGRLLDLGDFPGLILAGPADPNPPTVPGELFEVPDLATLAALDRYEGFCPADPQTSLFLRVEAPVTLADGSQLRCWVYVYNLP